MALVIDELPYLADVEPGLLTMLQHWWDAHKRQPNLKIFLRRLAQAQQPQRLLLVDLAQMCQA